MNKDNARLVAEVGAAARQLREQQALNQALADGARGDAEREALRTTLNTQVAELAHAREMLAPPTAERAYLAAQLDAQQSLLAEYRARVVSCRDFFEMSCRVVSCQSQSSVSVSMTPWNVGALDGTCPAPQVVTVFGSSYSFSYEPLCTVVQKLRPLVLALCAFVAALIVATGVGG